MQKGFKKINIKKVKPLNKQQLRNITGGLADPNFAVILDSWIDSDGSAQGGAASFLVF